MEMSSGDLDPRNRIEAVGRARCGPAERRGRAGAASMSESASALSDETHLGKEAGGVLRVGAKVTRVGEN